MNSKRYAMVFCLVGILVVAGFPVVAQEADESPEGKKVGFWGDRFALFVEAGTGSVSADDVNSSIDTGAAFNSQNIISFDDFMHARAGIGWQLPHGRGYFKVEYNGFKEEGYTLQALGNATKLALGSSGIDPDVPLAWWTMSIVDGHLTAERKPPSWLLSQDDANGNSLPDPEEVRYPDSPDMLTDKMVVDNLQNRYGTVDLLYGRDFGSRRIKGTWSCGLRHFIYEGNIVAPAWLGTENYLVGAGYTEDQVLRPLVINQDSTGIGPTGSLGIVFTFFRDRLELKASARSAFVIQSMSVDSGDFIIILRDTTNATSYPIINRLTHDLDKDVWHISVETGASYTMKNGLTIEAAYFLNSYHDAIMSPQDINIPGNIGQLEQGTAALYYTQNIQVDGYRAGIRYQF